MTQTQHAFQTEVTQLLDLMIHSLYSNREIFLRELLSNASDACDKLRFLALTEPKLLAGDDTLRIRVGFDAEAKTITITDTGIGMTEEEAIKHLGTIAHSGTKAFVKQLASQQKSEDGNPMNGLIGQFGVGFYSAFMVAERIVVETRSAHASADAGVRWESRGDGGFATESLAKPQRGTTVTLYLKDDASEFAAQWRLRELIKKYSDYVAYPILLPKYQSDEDKKAGKEAEDEQVNAGKPLWTRAKDEITDEQHAEFFQSACRQWGAKPATRLHFTVEGGQSFTALLYIADQKPHDLFDRDRRGLALYVRRVFIMDDCKDLLPEYLRFVRGVVDSDDLPLNVSREILQQQDTVKKLRKVLVKRILDHLARLADSTEAKDQELYRGIDDNFGAVLREGLVNDHENQDRLLKLARFRSTWTEAQTEDDHKHRTSIADYRARMPEGQESIWYITAAGLAAAKASPHLEGYRKRGQEVLFLTEPVDEWVASHLPECDGKKFASVAKGAAELGDEAEKKALEERSVAFKDLLAAAKDALGEGFSEVRLTSRLIDSPCCVVAGEHGMSSQFEELLRRHGQDVPAQQRVLELNPDHPVVAKLQGLAGDAARKDELAGYVGLLRDQALLAEGARVADPAAFAKRVQDLLGRALG